MSEREYGVAQICLNGHVIDWAVDEFPERSKKFCKKCGEETTTTCCNCNAEIQGIYWKGDRNASHYKVPSFCHNCGQSYPWTEARAQAARELAQELQDANDISTDDKEALVQSIDEMVKDTPRAELAATRFNRILSKIGNSPVAKALRNLVVDIASETARKIIENHIA